MDYLPTLGEKWPHSRGNVGKYSLHGSCGIGPLQVQWGHFEDNNNPFIQVPNTRKHWRVQTLTDPYRVRCFFLRDGKDSRDFYILYPVWWKFTSHPASS